MKDFIKYLPHPLFTGVMAAFIPLAQQLTGGYVIAWAAFAACACYFIGGATIKNGINVLACWAAGAAAAASIFWSFGLLSNPDGIGWNVTFALCFTTGFVTFLAMFFEKAKFLQMIPQWFIGAACMFAFHTIQLTAKAPTASYLDSGTRVVLSCLVGQTVAFVIAVGRTKYGAWVAGTEAAETKEESVAVEEVAA